MGHKIFLLSYWVFIVLMIVIFFLNLAGYMHFGVDSGNEITRIGIAVTMIVSIPFFILMNKKKSELLSTNLIRAILIAVMIAILIFLINDSLSHSQ